MASDMVNRGAYKTPRRTITRYLEEVPVKKWEEQHSFVAALYKASTILPPWLSVTSGNVAGARPEMLLERMESYSFETDIICLQEVPPEMPPSGILAYPFQTPLLNGTRANVQALIASKFPWSNAELWELPGTLGYCNSAAFVRFGDELILGCLYLQAGSVLSGGIESWALPHFHKCREQAVRWAAAKLATSGCRRKAMLGDFNFDNSGTEEDWPELKACRESGLVDAYANDGVITEDSDNNLLRKKGTTKRVRFDAVWADSTTESREVIWTDTIRIGNSETHRSDHWGLRFRMGLDSDTRFSR